MKILFPVVRFTEVSAQMAPLVRNMAKAFRAEIHLLRVEPMMDQFIAMRIKEAEEWLNEFTEKHFNGCPIKKAPIEAGDPAQKILQYIDENEIDCVIIGTHGRKGMNVLFGSVAKEIVGKSPIPVLTLNPQLMTKSFKARNAAYLDRILKDQGCR